MFLLQRCCGADGNPFDMKEVILALQATTDLCRGLVCDIGTSLDEVPDINYFKLSREDQRRLNWVNFQIPRNFTYMSFL